MKNYYKSILIISILTSCNFKEDKLKGTWELVYKERTELDGRILSTNDFLCTKHEMDFLDNNKYLSITQCESQVLKREGEFYIKNDSLYFKSSKGNDNYALLILFLSENKIELRSEKVKSIYAKK